MGQPRASRREVITASSDDEGSRRDENLFVPTGADEPVKSHAPTNGKLKPVRKAKAGHSPTPVASETSQGLPNTRDGSKAKNKATKHEAPKLSAKPIYSFFNAATQRQRASQGSASPDKPSAPLEELEAIHDDDAEDALISVAKASATALAVRKRKAQSDETHESNSALSVSGTHKFRKTSDSGKASSLTALNEDHRPWIEQFGPRDLTELAVHKRKVNDVQQWIGSTLSGKRRKVLILRGAAGTGKTTTVRLLAKSMGFGLSEWRNPAGFEQQAEGSSTNAAQFEDFIRRAGTSHGLALSTGDGTLLIAPEEMHQVEVKPDPVANQVLLIEEFPSTFSRTSSALQSFRSAILQYVSTPPIYDSAPVPIVLVVSETLLSTNTAAADSFTAHRLLGPELMTHPYVNTIEFNAVAPTILTKALESVVVREARVSGRRKTPGPQVLKRLAESGDIRSAVSSLQFLCVCGDDGDTWSSKVAFTKPKKSKAEAPLTKAEEAALRLVSNRESTLGIFHSVGKVVYNKRVEPASRRALRHPPSWLPHHRRPLVPETDTDSLIDELGTDTPTFLAALHENYALSCSSTSAERTLDSLRECIGAISDADMLSVDRFSFGTRAFSGSTTDSLRQDELSFQVVVRGLLFSLPSPVHRGMPANGKRGDAHRMFYPTSLKTWKQREEIDGVLDLLTSRVQDGTLDRAVAAHKQRSALAGSVESWKRNNTFNEQGDDSQADNPEAGTQLSIIAKSEMLLDRLPYMGQILSVRDAKDGSTTFDQILTVTRLQAPSSVDPDDDDAAAYGGEESFAELEPWTTDRPEISVEESGRRAARSNRKRGKLETEGGGLSIPVEHEVERLVLADDDIVDD